MCHCSAEGDEDETKPEPLANWDLYPDSIGTTRYECQFNTTHTFFPTHPSLDSHPYLSLVCVPSSHH